jgi:hypothetical protein
MRCVTGLRRSHGCPANVATDIPRRPLAPIGYGDRKRLRAIAFAQLQRFGIVERIGISSLELRCPAQGFVRPEFAGWRQARAVIN